MAAAGSADGSCGVNVVGLLADGGQAFHHELPHGTDPRVLSYDRGYVVERPVAATRDAAGVLELRLAVRARTDEPRPPQTGRGRDAGLELTGSGPIEVRQRVAAYALVTSAWGLLATEFSDRTSAPGGWGLPGGGIDDHEQPTDAVLREVAEETQQTVTLGPLVDVQSAHWVGRSPRDTIEDYHAVRLVYLADCPDPTTPVVVDIGGTTESARWVELDRWDTLAWTSGWRQLLAERLS